MFGKREFGVLVQVAPNGNQLLLVGQQLFDAGVGGAGGGCHAAIMGAALALHCAFGYDLHDSFAQAPLARAIPGRK